MIRAYRPTRPRPLWRDALTEWRTGLPMLSVPVFVFFYALTLEACCG